jgi:hypothetical protein
MSVSHASRLTGKTAAETISTMLAVFGRIDPHLRRSITFDNDTAFAQHGLQSFWNSMVSVRMPLRVSHHRSGSKLE